MRLAASEPQVISPPAGQKYGRVVLEDAVLMAQHCLGEAADGLRRWMARGGLALEVLTSRPRTVAI